MSMQTIDFQIFELNTGDKVLDVGCGEGRHSLSSYMFKEVDAIGVDLSLKDLNTTKERYKEFKEDNKNKSLHLIQANALQLPFADHSFDKIICSEVLEHIPDYHGVLLEIQRLLKPGGDFSASVPRYLPEKICWMLSDDYHQVEGGHIRIFKEKSLCREIESIGMICYEKHWAHALHSPFWWLKCLFWQNNEGNDIKAVQLYHRFLVWDLMKQPWLTQFLEKILNPLIGKSVVMYFRKGLN